MIGNAAGTVVQQVRRNDGNHARQNEHQGCKREVHKLVQHKQADAQREQEQTCQLVMMPAVTVPQSGNTDHESRSQQEDFQPAVVHQVHTQQGQTADQ